MQDLTAQSNCVSIAIYDALKAVRAVTEAHAAVGNDPDLDCDRLRPIRRMSCGGSAAALFSSRNAELLHGIANSLEASIAAETRTSIHFDECSMSGAWEETHVSERGHALLRLQGALLTLERRVSMVIIMRETERLAVEMR
ncbi:hypothetical protein HKX23_03015 [Sulfitobacter sp. KE29]|uniref:hypothetical protein n=1 Tax=unclassified Sulfitobacter TaxID=196795 RepID=UPI0023E2B83C|nr:MULTISPECIES: hypothetical protein [unclassified Sulfitobacter]MDF3417313.1 hypothetical protein [Sulfitobacter sp. Ks38]MDF3424795.1 hypothetical protein [Sulfitobacter sp. KE29]MDF3428375.1 hypothetical protein [Sulfitobacter sp. S46]MDF3443147.1 hypothetical protein [Sulfitobacter sp. KE31]MDF3547173.1 hypothetical protein [Sulfitobacter sp. KE28]